MPISAVVLSCQVFAWPLICRVQGCPERAILSAPFTTLRFQTRKFVSALASGPLDPRKGQFEANSLAKGGRLPLFLLETEHLG
ncbi:hypothetical protein BOTBODRAFT_25883 [Botryobasidium botryosum FD-172 SS1]|uniref:Uncharacterized protein n=1 Tax=Botryobasidium botryosum (strain FD-172 SS1) TaxID=930990 RepID=A0A067NCE4_BOTB1|nr:hypothetical protein BOTBODRAFT_25883 [Botryobasidium botryosum FD-172 SS1]